MSKITFYPKKADGNKIDKMREKQERITIQLRNYDEAGNYSNDDGRGNETIHIKGTTLKEAFEIIKSSLHNSKYTNETFDIE